MRIQVLGSGCQKCNDLYEQAKLAAAKLGPEVSGVDKIDDIDTFFRLGVTRTPALAVDDQVIAAGKVLTADEIVGLVSGREG
jgi:small redox-active disulfide protein 2